MTTPTTPNPLLEAYAKAMARFQHPEWYGVGVVRPDDPKHKPVAANSRNNPHPAIRTSPSGAQFRVKTRKTARDRLKHLSGEKPVFGVTRGDRQEALLAIDSDGVAGGDWAEVARRTRETVDGLERATGLKIDTFAEPGRSWPRKGGCYLWLRVFYGNMPGPERTRVEKLLTRALKKAAEADYWPEGEKIDKVAGTSTYITENPAFDPHFAASPSSRNHRVVEILPDCWISKWEARQSFKSQGLSRQQADEAVAALPEKWAEMTELEAYQTERLFYGLGDRATSEKKNWVRYEPRLEKTVRFFGELVTDPCFGALSGERENNIPAFLAWLEKPGVRVSAKRLQKALTKFLRSPVEELEARFADLADDTDSPSTTHTPRRIRPCADLAIAEDENQDPIERMRAWNRLYMRATGGDVERSAELTVAAYEGVGGPATGHSDREHRDRLDRAKQHLLVLATGFKREKARPANDGDFWLTPEKVAVMAADMQGFISSADIEATGNTRVTHRAIAAVYGCYLRLVSVVKKGWGEDTVSDAPVAAVAGLLKKLGMSLAPATIAAATRLLVEAKLIHQQRAHSKAGGAFAFVRGRARAFAINIDTYLPSWAKDCIPDQSTVARAAASVTTTAAAVGVCFGLVAAPVHTTPPDKEGMVEHASLESALAGGVSAPSVVAGGAGEVVGVGVGVFEGESGGIRGNWADSSRPCCAQAEPGEVGSCNEHELLTPDRLVDAILAEAETGREVACGWMVDPSSMDWSDFTPGPRLEEAKAALAARYREWLKDWSFGGGVAGEV